MEFSHLDDAVEALEKANADLQPELLTVAGARERLEVYARARKLIDYGIAALAARIDDATSLARSTGTSLPQATDTITTGKVLHDSAPLAEALRHGGVSLDQASEISKAEGSAPGSATGLLTVANDESFSVLRQKARRVKLEAEQHRDLAERQHNSRSARSGSRSPEDEAAGDERPARSAESVEARTQLRVGVVQHFGQDLGLADDRHEVGVTAPARDDVDVKVTGDARPRDLSEIDPEIEAMWVHGRSNDLDRITGEVHQLAAFGRSRLLQFADVT
jgi:hypothetical protein